MDKTPLSDIYFASIFSQYKSCLFVHLWMKQCRSRSKSLFWCNTIYWLVLHGSCLWCLLRNLCLTQSYAGFMLYFLLEAYNFRFYIWICYAFWINFSMWCEVQIEIHSFCIHPIVPVPFVENFFATKLPLNLKRWLSIYAWVYVWILSSVLLIHLSILGQEDPWRRKWQPTPVLLPRKLHGWRILVGYSPWGHKESDTTERLHSLTQSLDYYSFITSCEISMF